MSSYAQLQFDPLFGRLGWTLGFENGTNQNLCPTFLFDFCAHHNPISHLLEQCTPNTDNKTDIHRSRNNKQKAAPKNC